eukprot:3936852-Rhodomonas_salina.1
MWNSAYGSVTREFSEHIAPCRCRSRSSACRSASTTACEQKRCRSSPGASDVTSSEMHSCTLAGRSMSALLEVAFERRHLVILHRERERDASLVGVRLLRAECHANRTPHVARVAEAVLRVALVQWHHLHVHQWARTQRHERIRVEDRPAKHANQMRHVSRGIIAL